MATQIPTSFSSADSLEKLKAQAADAFRIVDSLFGKQGNLSVRKLPSDPFPNGTAVKVGDVCMDFTGTVPTLYTWDGKKWVPLGGTDTGTGGGGLPTRPPTGSTTGEIIVADGIDNPPEDVYNDEGGDYIYADS